MNPIKDTGPKLEPCCWKVVGQDGDYYIYERLCAQDCDHEHHEAERDQPGPLVSAAAG